MQSYEIRDLKERIQKSGQLDSKTKSQLLELIDFILELDSRVHVLERHCFPDMDD